MSLQQLKNVFATELYGMTVLDAQRAGVCIQCQEPASEKCYSEVGRREYEISGLCEKCFDLICSGEEMPVKDSYNEDQHDR